MKVALFAPPDVVARVAASEADTLTYLPVPMEDQMLSELDLRRWFKDMGPDITVLVLPQMPLRSCAEFVLYLRGYANVILAAVGLSKKLVLLGAGTCLNRVLGELCDWLAHEEGVNFVRAGRWYGDPVLAVKNVLAAEKTDTAGGTGPHQGGEVRDEVVPEQGCCEQYGPSAEAVLEMPVTPAQTEAPGDLRAECAAAEGEAEESAVYHYACPV